jgi:hypothetical protein
LFIADLAQAAAVMAIMGTKTSHMTRMIWSLMLLARQRLLPINGELGCLNEAIRRWDRRHRLGLH